jgi:hypothetical protein
VREVAPSVVIAAAELGIDRATAERLADLAMLLTAAAIERPAARRLRCRPRKPGAQGAWDALYGPDGKSLVTGEIARESAAELAEPTGED